MRNFIFLCSPLLCGLEIFSFTSVLFVVLFCIVFCCVNFGFIYIWLFIVLIFLLFFKIKLNSRLFQLCVNHIWFLHIEVTEYFQVLHNMKKKTKKKKRNWLLLTRQWLCVSMCSFLIFFLLFAHNEACNITNISSGTHNNDHERKKMMKPLLRLQRFYLILSADIKQQIQTEEHTTLFLNKLIYS